MGLGNTNRPAYKALVQEASASDPASEMYTHDRGLIRMYTHHRGLIRMYTQDECTHVIDVHR